jgi:sugar phosphate permease
MLYPVMPIYLKTIGFSIVLIGILEGVAEATAGLSKGYFGKLSDNSRKRVPFVQIGYAFSAISKPMMALFIYPLWIFFCTYN